MQNESEHAITYKNLKAILVREFGDKAFDGQKDVVRLLVLEEVNRRLAQRPARTGSVSLTEDLLGWLEVCVCVCVCLL